MKTKNKLLDNMQHKQINNELKKTQKIIILDFITPSDVNIKYFFTLKEQY